MKPGDHLIGGMSLTSSWQRGQNYPRERVASMLHRHPLTRVVLTLLQRTGVGSGVGRGPSPKASGSGRVELVL